MDSPASIPALLTDAEACAFLRLTDGRDIADARRSLDYLVRRHGLRPCRIGRDNRFSRAELEDFIRRRTEAYGTLSDYEAEGTDHRNGESKRRTAKRGGVVSG